MISRIQSRRLLAMVFLIAVAFAGLGYRLVELQVVDHDKYSRESEKLTKKTFLRAPRRGEIRDIRGNVLAGSVMVKTVCANPEVVREHRSEVAHVLAPLLQLRESDLYERMQPGILTNRGKLEPIEHVVLKKKVLLETWDQIQTALKELPLDHHHMTRREQSSYGYLLTAGITTEQVEDQIRIYPNQTLAAHVLGYVGAGRGNSPKGEIDEITGKDGVERALDKALRGLVGWRKTEFGKSHEFVGCREQDVQAHAGWNVILTLDSGIQHIVESELAVAMEKHNPISASGVVVRPRTGEVLAMATLPNFNPNDLSSANTNALRNRVLTDMHEPGSTFKIVVVSGALNDGIVTLDEPFDCENGQFYFAGRKLGDHEHWGLLTVEQIIMHSSNIGAAKIGIKMGSERLYQYILGFGFGSRTGILPEIYEAPGFVRKVKNWSKLSISRIPMGQEINVTPVQMVMAMCAIANGGHLMRPMLVDHLEDENGQVLFRYYPQEVRQVISERAARLTVEALKTVISTNGTGRKAILEDYTAAGKTGTAQKFVGHEYRHDRHFSSFIGFFPADNPEVCVAVFLDEPKNGDYGGEAAAPVFHNIAEGIGKYLAIKPDVAPPAPPAPAVPQGAVARLAARAPSGGGSLLAVTRN
jgi:cell division protein FtsI/penicillin-binding protein 2